MSCGINKHLIISTGNAGLSQVENWEVLGLVVEILKCSSTILDKTNGVSYRRKDLGIQLHSSHESPYSLLSNSNAKETLIVTDFQSSTLETVSKHQHVEHITV